ncbi:MAG: sulfurase [Nocardioides sp.]|nr:sulfurase [Nocardioides sp.]
MPVIRSVNVGRPRPAPWLAEGRRSSIDKTSVSGPVTVHELGLEGDQVTNLKHHGGVDKAVYAFAREDLDFWGDRLGTEIADGAFGENLTTEGLDVNEAEIGERWRIGGSEDGGGLLLEVRSMRTPCNVFQAWVGELGLDAKAWVRRFTEEGRPGPYLKVLEPGTVRAGDGLVVEHRPGHGVTVTTMFRALTTERELLPRLLEVDDLVREARAKALAARDGR